jgi:hypothetical protein
VLKRGEFNRFKFYDHCKSYIASPPDVLRIDTKFVAEYAIPNVCGVIITTNHKSDMLSEAQLALITSLVNSSVVTLAIVAAIRLPFRSGGQVFRRIEIRNARHRESFH